MATLRTTRRSLILGAALSACARERSAVRIGYQKNGILFIAKARGSLEKDAQEGGVGPIQWLEFQSGPPLMEAINAGSIDLGAVGESPPIFAQAANARFVYVAEQPVTGLNQAILVPVTSPIRTIEGLAGRRVAFTRGSSAHLFTLEALRTKKLGPLDIKEVLLSPADAAAAFATGKIDAWTIWDPFMSLALRRGDARILLTGETLPRTHSFFIAATAFANAAPDALTALLKAMRREASWINADPQSAAAIVAQATDLPRDILEAALRRNPLGCNPVTRDVIADQQAAANLFVTAGVLPRHVSIAERVWTGWPDAPSRGT